MTESLPYLFMLAALAGFGLAGYFAYRSAGVDPIRADRDHLRGEVESLRKQNTELTGELAAAKAARAGRAAP